MKKKKLKKRLRALERRFAEALADNDRWHQWARKLADYLEEGDIHPNAPSTSVSQYALTVAIIEGVHKLEALVAHDHREYNEEALRDAHERAFRQVHARNRIASEERGVFKESTRG